MPFCSYGYSPAVYSRTAPGRADTGGGGGIADVRRAQYAWARATRFCCVVGRAGARRRRKRR